MAEETPPKSGLGCKGYAVIGAGGLVVFLTIQMVLLSSSHRREVIGQVCLANISCLGKSSLMYAQDHDGRLPIASHWMDTLEKVHAHDPIDRCPIVVRDNPQGYGYAMMAKLSSADSVGVDQPNTVYLLFESTSLVKNASGGLELLPNPGRHDEKNSVVFLDCSAKAVPMH